jgi:DNA replication and repair protein RecF
LRIRKIHLTNFRNFVDVDVEFGERRNLIVGANAQGKTNLLEAIHILGVGRSHRDRKDANLVRFDEAFYRIEGVFEHVGVKTKIEASYGEERKRIRINGKEARPVDLVGLVGIVISSPDDIDLMKGGPGFRRTFLDMAISQMSKEYLVTLQRYVRALTQRNNLLRAAQERRVDASEAGTWTRSVVELGAAVVRRRVAYLSLYTIQEATRWMPARTLRPPWQAPSKHTTRSRPGGGTRCMDLMSMISSCSRKGETYASSGRKANRGRLSWL